MKTPSAWPRAARRFGAWLGAIAPEKALGLTFVVLAHLGGGYALWQATPRLLEPELAPVFVKFVAPETAPQAVVPPPRPAPPSANRPPPMAPAPALLADPTPLPAPVENVAPAVVAVAPPPVSVPVPDVPAPPTALPAQPMVLGGELAVSCKHRPAPIYPAAARRRGEEGRVVLRVELDERGQISAAAVATASGSRWLDEAALTAVRKWTCEPARRGGEVVRATAQQAFSFVLAGGDTPGAASKFD